MSDSTPPPKIHKSSQAVSAAQLGSPALPSLTEALHHHNEEVRQASAWALGQIGDLAAVPYLLAALYDPDWLTRRNAIAALGKLGDLRAIPRLLGLLDDPDPRLRAEAIEVLGKLGDPQAVPRLIEKLADDDLTHLSRFEDLRIHDLAAQALESLATPEALAAVQAWRSKF